MNRYLIAATFALIAVSGSACAAGTASAIVSDGKSTNLVDTYAYAGYDPTGRSEKPCPVIVLTDGAMDKAALNAAADPWDELRNQQNHNFHTVVVLHLLDDGAAMIDMISDDALAHELSDASQVLQVTQKTANHIEGSLVSKNAADKRADNRRFWDLHFATDLVRTVAAPKANLRDASDEPPPPPPPPPPPKRPPGQ